MKPFNKLFKLTEKNNIPLICTFELTRRCNLECRHCYIESASRNAKNELSTAAVIKILESLAGMGTLNLVFTGGEIFLRKDIIVLCRAAKRLNFDLRLFTNGTLLNENIVKKLAALKLSAVELSVYGRKRTHDYVTNCAGSFDKTLKAIAILKKYGIPVAVKAPLMNLNFNDYSWLKRFGKKNAINIKFDPTIAPQDTGNTANLKYRMNADQLKKIYIDNPDELAPVSGTTDLTCSAGRNMISVGFDATVYPCLQLLVPVGNAKSESIKNIWSSDNKKLGALRKIKNSNLPLCKNCDFTPYCQRCPGLALLEDGDILGPSKTSCLAAKLRKQLVEKSK